MTEGRKELKIIIVSLWSEVYCIEICSLLFNQLLFANFSRKRSNILFPAKNRNNNNTWHRALRKHFCIKTNFSHHTKKEAENTLTFWKFELYAFFINFIHHFFVIIERISCEKNSIKFNEKKITTKKRSTDWLLLQLRPQPHNKRFNNLYSISINIVISFD